MMAGTEQSGAFSLERFLNPNHEALFESIDPELIVYGGANAGKSYSIADKLLLQAILQRDRQIRCLVIRKTFPSLRHTALQILEERADAFKLPFRLTEGKWIATVGNLTFVFLSLNNKEDFNKLKSMTNIDFIWINELTEIRQDDYEECLRRLRGGHSCYEQIIGDFNPVGKFNWVYNRFFKNNINDARKLRYTIRDNHPDYLATPKAQRELARLEATKNYNRNLYKIYFLGEWGELEGIIFDWDIVQKPEGSAWFDEVIYCGDFGYTIDPACFIRIYRKGNEYWLEEIFYQTGLTNQDIARKMGEAGIGPYEVSYWDSAEPKSIQEICDAGYNAKPAAKGPDSVRNGIDFLLQQKIHILEGSTNIEDEQRSYVRQEDKDGNLLPIPVQFKNHAMDAIRYGIVTHAKEAGASLRVLAHSVYPD